MLVKPEVQLGDKARDKITGLAGIVVAKTQWLNGCNRVTIQPQEIKDSKIADMVTLDIDQFELIETDAYGRTEKPAPSGGPMPEPARATDPR